MSLVVLPPGQRPEPLPSAPSTDLWQTQVATASGALTSLAEVIDKTHTDAFVVWHEGTLVAEHYGEEFSGGTPHPLYSITKSYLGVLAGIMQERGLLDPALLASHYVPELAAGGYATARVRDLLDMRTGGDYVEDYLDPDGEIATLGAIAGWLPDLRTSGTNGHETTSAREYLATVARPALTDGPFSYRSADSEVLGWVLERAGGEPLADLLHRLLLVPLGQSDQGLLLCDRDGAPVASGGLHLSPHDVVRFGVMLLNGGTVGGQEVVSPMFIKDTRWGEEDSVSAFAERVWERLGSEASGRVIGLYRNQIWVPRRGGRQLLALGIHGQVLLIDPDNAVVALKLSSWPQPQDPDLFTDGLIATATAAATLGGVLPEGLSLLT